MKRILLIVTLFALFAQGRAFAQGSNIDTKKYKFDMVIPEGYGFKQSEKDGFTKIEGYNLESDTKINAYAYVGNIEKAKIYQFGAKESGIAKESWIAIDNGETENGFAWWEVYEAEVGKKMMYAVVAKNAYNEVYYMFYALATPASYEKYQDQYLEWAMSCTGIE
ncbi:hypothetical protein SAMN04488028_10956 [Reichenbachiella agariperforans]|uniref:Uncharacterized protein n=1 Tax=Reichenbachiella agariperforans TaxID=156994 RepID=A0A1M6VHT3_REIAG|nr:hypothetical protein [Reichenbachiella agariperforans]SHK81062.1 hypothetical protein SAMN04488028_10956 [Reichenbachiella agariperforans]